MTNSDPRAGFFALFLKHWRAGTGLDVKLPRPAAGWDYRRFANVADKVGGAPDQDTVGAWLKSARWPQRKRKEVILAVFFPSEGGNDDERRTMQAAWEEGERAPRRPNANGEVAGEDRLPPKWVRYDETFTEGLAELGLSEPQPTNEDGVYRIEGEPLVTVAEPEIDGRDLRIGVNSVVVLFDSDDYAIQPDSLISKRRQDLPIKSVVRGVQVAAADATTALDGSLWEGEHFATIKSSSDKDGPIHFTVRTARTTRRSFRVEEIDSTGRARPIHVTQEVDAVLNILLGRDQDKDTLGRVALAKVSMRRTTE